MEYSYEIGNSDKFISELMLLIAENTYLCSINNRRYIE